jgi:hypothetical protein
MSEYRAPSLIQPSSACCRRPPAVLVLKPGAHHAAVPHGAAAAAPQMVPISSTNILQWVNSGSSTANGPHLAAMPVRRNLVLAAGKTADYPVSPYSLQQRRSLIGVSTLPQKHLENYKVS